MFREMTMWWFEPLLFEPEIKRELGREGSAEAVARAREMYLRRRRSRVAAIILATPLAAAYFVGFTWLLSVVPALGSPWWLIATLPAAAVPPIIVVAMTRRRMKNCHLHALRDQGFELCSGCGYWLRGLGQNVKQCPECGAERAAVAGSSRSSP